MIAYIPCTLHSVLVDYDHSTTTVQEQFSLAPRLSLTLTKSIHGRLEFLFFIRQGENLETRLGNILLMPAVVDHGVGSSAHVHL